jgi:hypothetical protein
MVERPKHHVLDVEVLYEITHWYQHKIDIYYLEADYARRFAF